MNDHDSTNVGRRQFVKGVGAALSLAPLVGVNRAAAGPEIEATGARRTGNSMMNDTFLRACRGERVDYTPV